jgi:putative toxin-antitoxin system antitoxin component (TIGR02293 family)
MTQAKAVPQPAAKGRSKASQSGRAGALKSEARKGPASRTEVDVFYSGRGSSEGRRRSYVIYVRTKGIDDFVTNVHAADPLQLIETERKGVAGIFVKDLAKRMEIAAQRMFEILGVPKATAEKKIAAGEVLSGSGGRAALGMAKLLGIAKEIVENSTAPEARGFDAAKWLGQWLERPQPSLGGRRPSELLDTPTGLGVVTRLLGAIESGAYQ